jgi:dienelactone hydrolase
MPADITLRAGDAALEGALVIPQGAHALVLFAHGSGSSRFGPRNRSVAQFLNRRGIGTLLFDLLTAEESGLDERGGVLRFDIALLSRRLIGAIDWAASHPGIRTLPLGLFGASTGAAAALVAAAQRPARVAAVVSRGGRPDLAGAALARVRAPTLLIVGELDHAVIALNEQAAVQLACEHRLEIVPGAGHLFAEPGALERVARLACEWFQRYLAAPADHTGASLR